MSSLHWVEQAAIEAQVLCAAGAAADDVLLAAAAGGGGGGWVRLLVADENQTPYYYNRSTEVSQWERPAELVAEQLMEQQVEGMQAVPGSKRVRVEEVGGEGPGACAAGEEAAATQPPPKVRRRRPPPPPPPPPAAAAAAARAAPPSDGAGQEIQVRCSSPWSLRRNERPGLADRGAGRWGGR